MGKRLWAFGSLLVVSALIASSCVVSRAASESKTAAQEAELCVDKDTGTELTYQEALQIALNSECVAQGALKVDHYCNADTGTWWIDMDADESGCNPACVIDVNSRMAEINWRCTGLFPSEDTPEAIEMSDQVQETWDTTVEASGQVPEHGVPANPIEVSVVAWYGHVVSLPVGAQFDDYVAVWPEGSVEVGISGADDGIGAAIVALRDKTPPNMNAHFWGTLYCEVPDYGGCQLVVDRLRPDGPGPLFDPDPVEGWEGAIYSGPKEPRSGGDDYLMLSGGFPVEYGIWAADEALREQLEGFRDTGTVIRVWGELVAGIPDWNGTQIQVSQVEIVED